MNQILGSNSMAIQHKINFSTQTSRFTAKSHFHKIHNKSHILYCQSNSKFNLSASAANNPILSEEQQTPHNKEKLGVVVKPMEKQRIVLKLIWMEKTIGIALDQVIPGFGTIPLTPYYFWGKEDALEQLKMLLESKPWISYKQMNILLNQATHIFKLRPENG